MVNYFSLQHLDYYLSALTKADQSTNSGEIRETAAREIRNGVEALFRQLGAESVRVINDAGMYAEPDPYTIAPGMAELAEKAVTEAAAANLPVVAEA